jgi:chromosomal replication initiator protein
MADPVPPAGFLFIGPYLVPKPRRTLVCRIQAAVAEHYGIRRKELLTPGRLYVEPRHVAMYLSRRIARRSYQDIGARFGGRDHTGARSACVRMEGRREIDEGIDSLLGEFERRFDYAGASLSHPLEGE